MTTGTGAPRLWIFDFDGTLSPIVPDRAAARLHPDALALLRDLCADPRNRVAVLSTRALDDLSRRVPVSGVILGASAGLAWRLPDGRRIQPGRAARRRLEEARARVLPLLERIRGVPDAQVEDKGWSVAVHYRAVHPDAMPALVPLLEELDRVPGIRLYSGPMAAEVQLVRSAGKALGVRLLCRFLRFDAGRDRLFYAGDDENDAAAMRWVLAHHGTVFAAGNQVRIPGVLVVDGPAALVHAVRAQTGAGGPARRAAEEREPTG